MKIIQVVSYIILSTILLEAKTEILIHNEGEKYLMQYEIELLDGTQLEKYAKEKWILNIQDKKLNLKGSNKDSIIVVVSFLNGKSMYSIDKHLWHQKTFGINNYVEQIVKSKIITSFDSHTNTIKIDFYSDKESNTKFYLMPILGNNRNLLGSTKVNQGRNQIIYNIENINSGNYFLIADQNNCCMFSKILIL